MGSALEGGALDVAEGEGRRDIRMRAGNVKGCESVDNNEEVLPSA